MTTLKPTLESSARAGIAARTEALFRSSGALRDGHFLLKSGRHSSAYLEKFAVLSDPAATSELCGFWAGQFRARDAAGDGPEIDVVAGPTTGGVILAFETGRQLGPPGDHELGRQIHPLHVAVDVGLEAVDHALRDLRYARLEPLRRLRSCGQLGTSDTTRAGGRSSSTLSPMSSLS